MNYEQRMKIMLNRADETVKKHKNFYLTDDLMKEILEAFDKTYAIRNSFSKTSSYEEFMIGFNKMRQLLNVPNLKLIDDAFINNKKKLYRHVSFNKFVLNDDHYFDYSYQYKELRKCLEAFGRRININIINKLRLIQNRKYEDENKKCHFSTERDKNFEIIIYIIFTSFCNTNGNEISTWNLCFDDEDVNKVKERIKMKYNERMKE